MGVVRGCPGRKVGVGIFMNMRGEGTDLATRQGMLLDVLLGVKRDLSGLDIDIGRRDALTARIDALSQAVEAAQALADAALGALDRIAVGIALVDGGGTVLWSNRHLHDIATEDDGLTITAGRLRVHGAAQTRALDQLIAQVLDEQGAADGSTTAVLTVDRRRQQQPYLIAAFPLRGQDDGRHRRPAAAAVFVADPERRVSLPARDLERLFGLTPAESQVAALLAAGDRLDAAAEKLGVTTGTARTHLKHIFDKTRTGRQSELARLLTALHGKIR